MLCLFIAPALFFHAVEGDLAKDNRDHLEGRAATQACGQKQAHKDQIEGDKAA